VCDAKHDIDADATEDAMTERYLPITPKIHLAPSPRDLRSELKLLRRQLEREQMARRSAELERDTAKQTLQSLIRSQAFRR
jgi:hypothetical protein